MNTCAEQQWLAIVSMFAQIEERPQEWKLAIEAKIAIFLAASYTLVLAVIIL